MNTLLTTAKTWSWTRVRETASERATARLPWLGINYLTIKKFHKSGDDAISNYEKWCTALWDGQQLINADQRRCIEYLHRSAFGWQRRETDNVAEIDCDALVKLGYDRLSSDQLFCYSPVLCSNVSHITYRGCETSYYSIAHYCDSQQHPRRLPLKLSRFGNTSTRGNITPMLHLLTGIPA